MEFWIVFSTAGQMNFQDVLNECKKEGWTPVTIIRKSKKVIVPYFTSQDVALEFCRLNFGEELWGTVSMTLEDVIRLDQRWAKGKGWSIERFKHASLVKKTQMDVEIHEFVEKPDVFAKRK